jgi:parallel beta-helix repeat protein
MYIGNIFIQQPTRVYGMSDSNSKERGDSSDSTNDGLLNIDRRSVMKAAGASAGAAVGGGTLLGSATAETADGNCVQIDFVTGASEISDLSSSTYSDTGRLVAYKWGNAVGVSETGESGDRTTFSDTCDIDITGGNPLFNGTSMNSTVNYQLSGCGGDQDLLLVSYESPCNGDPSNPGWDPANADQQTVFDTATATTQSDGSLTVDIPPLPAGVPQRDQAVAYYPLDTAAGTDCINNTSLSKNNVSGGSLNTGASGVSANTNNAFDLSDDYELKSGSDLSLNGTSGTVAGWFNIDSSQFQRVLQVGGSRGSTPTNGYDLFLNGQNDLFLGLKSNGSNTGVGNFTLSTDTWYFAVAVVGDGSDEARLHVFDKSGELAGSPATSSDTNRNEEDPKPLFIGSGADYFDGQIDEVFGFSTALTTSEVTSLYNASNPSVQNTTQGTGYDTIQAAIDSANDGDTIEVQPGTYSENVTIPGSSSGITVQTTGDYTNTTINTAAGVNVNGSNSTVDGFSVVKTSNDSTGLVYVSGGGSTISNCRIDGNGNVTGTNASGSGAVEVQANATVNKNIIENAAQGIRLVGSSNQTTATDNIIRSTNDNAVRGETFGGAGINVTDSSVTGNDIINNDFGFFVKSNDADDLDATNNFFNNNQFGNGGGEDADISSPASSSVASGPDGFTG